MTPPIRPLLRTGAFALLFAVAAVVGRLTMVDHSVVNLVWPAAGVGALWLLLQHGRRTYLLDCALLVAVVVVVDLATGSGLPVAVALGLVNLGQSALVGLVYRRVATPGRPGALLLDMRDLGALLLAAGVATTAGAVAGTAVLHLAHGGGSLLGLLVWQARNGAAVLAVVALGLRVRQLVLARRGTEHPDLLPFLVPRGWRAVELATAVVASVLGNVAVFWWLPQYPVAFPLFALTAWVALRFDTGLTALRTACVSVVAVVATLMGEGPFASVDDVLVRAGIVQAYVAIGAVLGLALALNRDQRLVLVRQLRAAVDYSEERHRQVRVLAQASRTVLLADDPRQAICAAVQEAVGADGVYLLEPDGEGRLVSSAVVGLDLPPLSFRTDPPTTLTALLFVDGTAHFATDVAREPDVSLELVEHLGVASAAWQPAVLADDRVVALIGVMWRTTVPEFCDTTRGVLTVLGGEAARAIERGNLLEQLARAADRDQLTGLANRRRWEELSTVEVSRAQRNRLPLTFLLLDLDHFKRVNDLHGHAVGDGVLIGFCHTVQALLPEGAIFGRMGGEEFACLLPGLGPEEALAQAEFLRRAVSRIAVPELPHLAVNASIGLATTDGRVAEAGCGLDALLSLADAALYRAKRNGRGRSEAASPLPLRRVA